MVKKEYYYFFVLLLLFTNMTFVVSTNGCGSIGDVECGTTPVLNCDVTEDTVFEFGEYDIPFGIDICADDVVLDCNGATLNGDIATIGVNIENINGSIIKNCRIKGYNRGIYIEDSYGNQIIENEISSSFSAGIRIFSSDNNTISDNSVNDTLNSGIEVKVGNSNSILSNIVSFNDNGVFIKTFSDNNLVMNNNIYSNNDGVSIILNSNNNSIIENTLNSNDWGISLLSSSNNLFEGNTINFNTVRGIGVGFQSSSNIIKSNTFNLNLIGINIDINADNILVYDNYFANSLFNAEDPGFNSWNVKKDCSQRNIVGGPCVGGNFWHDYKGEDIDGDGIGDTEIPYDSNGLIFGDLLPLVEVNDVCVGDTDNSGEVDVQDLINVIVDWGTDGSENNGDVDGSGIVDVGDLVEVIINWGTCGNSASSEGMSMEIPAEVKREIRSRLGEGVMDEVKKEMSIGVNDKSRVRSKIVLNGYISLMSFVR